MKSEISKYLAGIGRKGGKTTGKAKARTTAQASAAARAMWAKRRTKKEDAK
jgi:hypothetical protein